MSVTGFGFPVKQGFHHKSKVKSENRKQPRCISTLCKFSAPLQRSDEHSHVVVWCMLSSVVVHPSLDDDLDLQFL